MSSPIYQVDSFTEHAFSGNPAGVCLPNSNRDSSWMQSVALEMNLAETAFLEKTEEGYQLRWFTPQVEVDLCGHATLAAAWILWTEGHVDRNESISFQTRSGNLLAALEGDEICLDFPARLAEPCEANREVIDSLELPESTRLDFFGRNVDDYLMVLSGPQDGEQTIRAIQPDFRRLKNAESIRGLIVTSRSDAGPCDFVSRFFAPAVGIDEDPVTGSAHCCLAPYWSQQLGKNELVGYQASPRGGIVRMKHQGERVQLRGRAVTVIKGNLVFE